MENDSDEEMPRAMLGGENEKCNHEQLWAQIWTYKADKATGGFPASLDL